MVMTESPQQPGYDAAQQQQAAAYAAQQQQAYAAQAYAQPAPNVFDKLPMNIQTLGLAAAGALLLLLGSMIMGAESLNVVLLVSSETSPLALVPLYGIIALTGIAITTGPTYRNTYRAIVTGLAALELGNIVAMFLSDNNPDEGALIIGIILYIFAIGCMTAATYTMAEKPVIDPQLAAMQAAQAQQQAAAQQAAAQQQQQYQATQALQQPTGEQPTTTWQQQPPPQQ